MLIASRLRECAQCSLSLYHPRPAHRGGGHSLVDSGHRGDRGQRGKRGRGVAADGKWTPDCGAAAAGAGGANHPKEGRNGRLAWLLPQGTAPSAARLGAAVFGLLELQLRPDTAAADHPRGAGQQGSRRGQRARGVHHCSVLNWKTKQTGVHPICGLLVVLPNKRTSRQADSAGPFTITPASDTRQCCSAELS